MRIVEGAIAELGPAHALASRDLETDAARKTGTGYAFVRLVRAGGKRKQIDEVMVGAGLASHFTLGAAGRFAFYQAGRFHVLCGFSDGAQVLVAAESEDPLAIETDVQRTLGKRKIVLAIVLMPTIIGLFFAFDILRAGRRILTDNPRPRRPSEAKIRRRLER